ncbi:hypothetical protein [Clostridium sp.]
MERKKLKVIFINGKEVDSEMLSESVLEEAKIIQKHYTLMIVIY